MSDVCQNVLDNTGGVTADEMTAITGAISAGLRTVLQSSFDTAVFLGSASDYNYITLHTDVDALAGTDGTSIGDNLQVYLYTGDGSAPVEITGIELSELVTITTEAGVNRFRDNGRTDAVCFRR